MFHIILEMFVHAEIQKINGFVILKIAFLSVLYLHWRAKHTSKWKSVLKSWSDAMSRLTRKPVGAVVSSPVAAKSGMLEPRMLLSSSSVSS